MPNAEYIIKRDNCKVKEKTLQNEYTLYIAGRNLLPESINFCSPSLELLKRATMVFFQQQSRCHWGCRNGHPHFYIHTRTSLFMCRKQSGVVLEDAEVKLELNCTFFCCASRFWRIGIDGLERTMLYEQDTQVYCDLTFVITHLSHVWLAPLESWKAYASRRLLSNLLGTLVARHVFAVFLPWMGVGNARIWAAKNRGFGEFGVAAHWRHFFAIVHCLGLEDGLWHSEW